MVCRRFWLEQIKHAWERRPLICLAGVRRVGKTYLCQSLADIEYFDCELPRVRLMMADPQSFLSGLHNRTVVLDEIHRLPNPSELLKIATDHFPSLKVLATLGASAKFRDTLVGRKAELWLTPMIFADLDDFQNNDLNHRFLFGACHLSFWPGIYRSGIFRNGWIPIGPRISRNCSAWNGGRAFLNLSNCCCVRAGAYLRPAVLPVPA